MALKNISTWENCTEKLYRAKPHVFSFYVNVYNNVSGATGQTSGSSSLASPPAALAWKPQQRAGNTVVRRQMGHVERKTSRGRRASAHTHVDTRAHFKPVWQPPQHQAPRYKVKKPLTYFTGRRKNEPLSFAQHACVATR